MTLLISINSPNKFKEGGEAILLDLKINQNKESEGIKIIKPLLIINLRLFTRS